MDFLPLEYVFFFEKILFFEDKSAILENRGANPDKNNFIITLKAGGVL